MYDEIHQVMGKIKQANGHTKTNRALPSPHTSVQWCHRTHAPHQLLPPRPDSLSMLVKDSATLCLSSARSGRQFVGTLAGRLNHREEEREIRDMYAVFYAIPLQQQVAEIGGGGGF